MRPPLHFNHFNAILYISKTFEHYSVMRPNFVLSFSRSSARKGSTRRSLRCLRLYLQFDDFAIVVIEFCNDFAIVVIEFCNIFRSIFVRGLILEIYFKRFFKMRPHFVHSLSPTLVRRSHEGIFQKEEAREEIQVVLCFFPNVNSSLSFFRPFVEEVFVVVFVYYYIFCVFFFFRR